MEKLEKLLTQMSTEWTALRESLAEAQGSISERKKRNKLLRERLDQVKGDVSNKMNDLFGNILGVDVTAILSGTEIDGHLTDAFNKFDANHNGKLDQWEFTQVTIYSTFTIQENVFRDMAHLSSVFFYVRRGSSWV